MSAEERSSESEPSETKTIAPHDEAGYAPCNVLKDAEEGDEIYLEMDFADHVLESGWGTVANVVEEETDDLVTRTYQIEGVGSNEMTNIALKYAPGTWHVILRENVRFVKPGVDDYVLGKLDDLAHAKVEREVEA